MVGNEVISSLSTGKIEMAAKVENGESAGGMWNGIKKIGRPRHSQDSGGR